MPSRVRLRHALQAVCALAALWAVVVHVTGGVVVSFDAIRLSSRYPRNPMLIAALAGLAVWALARPHPRRMLRDDAEVWGRRGVAVLHVWRAHWGMILAAALASVAAALAMHQWAGARPLWLDEQMIVLNLRERSVTELAGPLWLGQSAPFGWLALERLALVTFGESEPALRLVPLCFGLATLVAALWVGRRWMESAGAPLLVLLCVAGQWVAYYIFELKHYSADVFWGLWLPALAAWAMEAEHGPSRKRRVAIWWTAAAVGQWTANGALLVTPGCAAVLLTSTWRRHGWRESLWPLWLASIWLLSFGLHYLVAIRHTLGSTYLSGYWTFAFPPESAGVWGTLTWLAMQLEPIARKPGGSEWSLLFWLAAMAGWVFTSRRSLGLVMASVPLAACALAVLRLVPLFERLTLWAVPALYVGIALGADQAVRFARAPASRRTLLQRVPARATGLVLLLAVALVGMDIVRRGYGELMRATVTNHRLDDRKGVQWLLFNHRPGDVVMTTRLALPAIWWYGGVPIGGASGGGQLADGSPILEVGYQPPGERCRADRLRDALQGRRRALVYFGFRFDDVPAGFDRLLLDELSRIGTVRAVQRFTDAGHAVVFDLGAPMAGEWDWPLNHGESGTAAAPLDGCLDVRVASRW